MEVEAIMGSNPPLNQKDWHRIKEWYRAVVNRDLPPTRVTLKWITTERVDLYSYVPPPRANIPIYVEPFLVYNSVPT